MATFLWLHENDSDPNRQLQNLARASVAAARAGDRAEFARTFRLLAGQDDRDDEPGDKKPGRKNDKSDKRADRRADKRGCARRQDRGRRQARHGGQGRQGGSPGQAAARRGADRLGRTRPRPREAPRGALGELAARAAGRRARRAAGLVENDDQANLATLVDTLKRHLGDGGRGPVDEELTTLYRAASAHLKTGARAYAETVGAERRPILLGDVLIGRKYDVPPPLIDLSVGARRGRDRWCSSPGAETTPARRRLAAVAGASGRGLDRERVVIRRRASIVGGSASASASDWSRRS